MFNSWYSVSMLAFEAQYVMWLRMMKLAAGGPMAAREAERMVAEKIAVATQASAELMSGRAPARVVLATRRKVRANRRRLSK